MGDAPKSPVSSHSPRSPRSPRWARTSDAVTSQALSAHTSRAFGALGVALASGLLLPAPVAAAVAVGLFVVLNAFTMRVKTGHGILLGMVWAAWLITPAVGVLAALSFGLGGGWGALQRWWGAATVVVYVPLLLIFARPNMHELPWLSQVVQSVAWDPPLLLWMRIIAWMGGRALAPFISEVGHGLLIGSLPLDDSDAQELLRWKVVAVLNLCREDKGPLASYGVAGIRQLRLPTPDLASPSLETIQLGVSFILKERSRAPENNVLVHCKGGRGRAATVAAAYLMFMEPELTPSAAVAKLRAARPVVSGSVARYPALAEFAALRDKNRTALAARLGLPRP